MTGHKKYIQFSGKMVKSPPPPPRAKTKAAYDEKAQERHFEPGDMVLCHTPGLTGKLHSIWTGPYEVTAKISDINYKLAVPDKRSQTEVVHINRQGIEDSYCKPLSGSGS